MPAPSPHQLGQPCLRFRAKWAVHLLPCSPPANSLPWWFCPLPPTRPGVGLGNRDLVWDGNPWELHPHCWLCHRHSEDGDAPTRL